MRPISISVCLFNYAKRKFHCWFRMGVGPFDPWTIDAIFKTFFVKNDFNTNF